MQNNLFSERADEMPADTSVTVPTPAEAWEKDAAKRALDELFRLTSQYRMAGAFRELMLFVARFRMYSPFNAMLIHMQKPGAAYVAPPTRWLAKYRRVIRPGTRPMVILQPRGPVLFVFDVSDTEPLEDAPPLPREVDRPFEVRSGKIRAEFALVVENAKRDGIRITEVDSGSLSAGSIQQVQKPHASQAVWAGINSKKEPVFINVPVRFELLVNRNMSAEARYVTVAHELGHLYCGHLGTPNKQWWPDRRGLDHSAREFEAESAAYLVCGRVGIDNPSERYLADYARNNEFIPTISIDCVMKAAGLIETMSREKRMKPRKAKNE